MRDTPKAGMGHPDPSHPTNRIRGDEKRIFDYEGRPVVHGMPWADTGTGLWLFMIMTPDYPTTPDAPVGAKEPRMGIWTVGGVSFAVGVCEGRPKWSNQAVYGNAMELPVDLGRDPMKQTFVTDWLKDTALECLVEAVDKHGFTGIPGDSAKMGRFITGAAEKAIRGMGL